jgi:transposase
MPRGSNFQKPYPPEFRGEAVALCRRSGRPLREIASDLGVATESLGSWVKQVGVDAGLRDGLGSEEREELSRLRRENRVLREEREVVRKAAAFLAGESETR